MICGRGASGGGWLVANVCVRASPITIGSYTSGRVRRDLDPMLGLVSNPIPLRIAVDGQAPFWELVQRVDDGSHLVDVEVRIENQLGEVTAMGTSTVELQSRAAAR